jgi:hypothetical protein
MVGHAGRAKLTGHPTTRALLGCLEPGHDVHRARADQPVRDTLFTTELDGVAGEFGVTELVRLHFQTPTDKGSYDKHRVENHGGPDRRHRVRDHLDAPQIIQRANRTGVGQRVVLGQSGW